MDDVYSMGVDPVFDIPDGSSYEDVSQVFTDAANEMDPEVLVMTETFSLLDAMSAFEIGEPRMDSGMVSEHEQRPPFDLLAPMLPQEICWILDRAFASEMEWHAGCSLTQTVYTLLYVHYLDDLNPDFVSQHVQPSPDPRRPLGLLTVVMRAAVMGLLKCCDLAWRELSKGRVYDIEDWLGEKSEVSLLEAVSADFVLKKIDEACIWLRHSTLTQRDIECLCDRLILRKSVMQLLKLNPPLDTAEVRKLVSQGRVILAKIVDQEPSIPKNSPAFLAFDPRISRRLSNFMPTRVIDLPPQEQTWDALGRLFEGWEELVILLDTPCVSTWEIAGNLRIWSRQKQLHVAYVRSLTQSVIYDRNAIIGKHPPIWLVECFFQESIGISYDTVLHKINLQSDSSAAWLKGEIEKMICKHMIADMRANSHNPPRRRRYLMKAALQWQEVHDHLLQIVSYCRPLGREGMSLVDLLSNIATMRRLTAAREIILSGFQQDLYAKEEISVAYWYLSRILEVHLECIDQVLCFTAQANEEMKIQFLFLTALQMMTMAMCPITYKQCTLPYQRVSLNFVRRYKWAFKPEYNDLAPAFPLPDLRLFKPEVEGALHDGHFSPSQTLQLAGDLLGKLIEARGFAGIWAAERRAFFRDLARVCRRLVVATAASRDVQNVDSRRLRWDGRTHPWFPDVVG